MDFDDINMISFEKGERIIDMRIYHNKNKNNENDIEKIIIACTKNMIFKFIGKENTFGELFKKYSSGSEILSKSFRIFPNKSNSNNYNSTRLQILPSYTNTKNEKIVFGCMGGFGYCLGEIEDNIDDNTKNDNLSNIYVFNYRKPKYVSESKIPLFSFGDNSNSKNTLYPIMACQSKLYDNKFFLFPCGHIFDADCLVKILYEYDANDIGGEDLKKKVQAVRNLSEKIMNMQRKKSSQKTNIFIGGFNKLSSKTKTTMKKFLNFVLVEQKAKENENEFEKIEKEKEKEKEKLRINEEESELTKEEETLLKNYLKDYIIYLNKNVSCVVMI